MYGSQFHFEQALTTKRYSTSLLKEATVHSGKSNKLSKWMKMFLILTCLSISSITLAGSSQPRLAGGNGNANGR